VSWFLRIDGEETDLVGGRLVWQRGVCAGRRGFVFHLAAHGGRRVLHVTGWAPGDAISDLSNQAVRVENSGPDAAVDGRFFTNVDVRFGRVTAQRAVVSIDGDVEDIDPGSSARARVEADIGSSVEEVPKRPYCLGCGTPLAPWLTTRDEFVGAFRVETSALPVECPACTSVATPRFCPTCGTAFADDHVVSSAADGALGYTATCDAGHIFSGRLGR
jgi:hypothetical protein